MKNIFQKAIFAILLLTVAGCSNDFLNENIEKNAQPAGESTIYISPTWEASNYQFMLPNAGNADFVIETTPSWLNIGSTRGTLVNGVATIHCSTTKHSDFDKTGIYLDKIQVTANGTTFFVPVAYINEGNPKIQVERTLTIGYNSYYSPHLHIENTGNGILLWDIISMPQWLSIDMNNINLSGIIIPQHNSYSLPLTFDSEALLAGELTGSIVLKTNDKNNPEIEIIVTADLGTPQLNLWKIYQLDFGITETSKALEMRNYGSGILAWHFEDLPEWLTVSPAKGVYYPGTYYDDIVFTYDKDKLQPGLNSATIRLVSNDPNTPSYPITITVRTSGSDVNVRALEGNIVDAAFDKNKNILYYTTSTPNKLVTYDVTTRTVLHEVDLSKAPTCFAISEDSPKAIVGHGGRISVVDLQNHTVTKTIEVSGVLADIDFAANNWCAYTEGGNYNIQHTNIYWVNLSDGSVTNGSDVYRSCIIKKVPNQDYIIGSEINVSAGLYVYDINNRTEKADIFESFKNFWFAGNYIVGSYGDIYRVSDITSKKGYNSDGVSPIGKLEYPTNDNYSDIPFIDYCPTTRSIFSLEKKYYWETTSPFIYQFEDNDYTLVNTYVYDNLYQPDAQTTAYEVQAQYVFANGTGTELSVLRKGNDNNNWSVEFIQITQ